MTHLTHSFSLLLTPRLLGKDWQGTLLFQLFVADSVKGSEPDPGSTVLLAQLFQRLGQDDLRVKVYHDYIASSGRAWAISETLTENKITQI